MPDFQQFDVQTLGSVSVTLPRFQISVKVTDSQTGATIADFTGANAFVFPGVLATLTAAQRRTILDDIVARLIRMKAGLE